MKNIENIAEFNAELFIRKHFSNINKKDVVVKTMKDSVRDLIKHALVSYEMQKEVE